MYGKLTRVLAAAMLTIGVASTSGALAEGNAPATPAPQPQSPMQGQGMMGDHGKMEGGGNMMGMMSAMTRMANTCNTMMESATHGPAAPAAPQPGSSHG